MRMSIGLPSSISKCFLWDSALVITVAVSRVEQLHGPGLGFKFQSLLCKLYCPLPLQTCNSNKHNVHILPDDQRKMMGALTASTVNDCDLSSLYVHTLYRSHSPPRPLYQSAAALSLIFPEESLTGTPNV